MTTPIRSRRGALLAGAAGLLFLASAALTVRWCGAMAGGMPMPGGWTMSMAWMLMPGQTLAGGAAAFLAMWITMMIAMMLPSLAASLARTPPAGAEPRPGETLALAAGYFLVWTLIGAAAYPVGLALAAEEMKQAALSRLVPLAAGLGLLLAGALQVSGWKARQLLACRDGIGCAPASPKRGSGGGAGRGWTEGIRLGASCARCCAGYTLALLAAGVMDLRVMAGVAAAITVERIAPRPVQIARVGGALVATYGAWSVARALVRA